MNKTVKKEKIDLLVFGYGLAVILSVISVRLWLKHGLTPSKIVLLVIAGIFLVLTMVQYLWLKPIYRIWMKGAFWIGHVISSLILIILFFGVFSVVGILLRILRKDLLNRKIEPEQSTYWIERKSDTRGNERYQHQF